MIQVSLSEFADKLNEIMPVIIKGFTKRQANELDKGKITLPQFLLMAFLNISAESKMKDLAHSMEVTTAAMTGIVERLVRSGYLTRAYEPSDRRIIKVRLTAKGSQLVNKVNQHRRQMVIRIFGRISENDRREYLRILMQIHDILNREKDA